MEVLRGRSYVYCICLRFYLALLSSTGFKVVEARVDQSKEEGLELQLPLDVEVLRP